MYYEIFGLNEPPFQLTPDSRYLFLSKAHRRAKAYMDYAVWKRDGFIVITGDIGAGKTTLINKLLSEIGKDLEVIRIFQTQLNEIEFLQSMLFELGVSDTEIHGLGKVELLHRLNHCLIDTYSQGRHIVLIVDEGQNLSTKVLEEIRMLSGLELDKEKLLNIILVGQPEMNQVLNQPNMTQLVQRIRLRFHLGPLKFEETIEYIKYRLTIAGAEDPGKIFHPDTYQRIFEYAEGIPRKINVLCDTALVCAFADNKSIVDVGAIKDALAELTWDFDFQTGNENVRVQPESNMSGVNYTGSGTSAQGIPPFISDDAQWRTLFSSLLKIMGDVNQRMQGLEKRIDGLHSRLDQIELSVKNSNVSPLPTKHTGR